MVDIAGQSIFMLIGNQPQFYIHCRVCDGANNGDIFPKPKGWSILLISRQKPDLAMVRNEAGKPFIYKP